MIERALRQMAAGHYAKAIDLLNSAGQGAQLENLKGVCLMRIGNANEAVRILRNLVVNAGCTWMRPDAPLVHKTNFATALLLAGHPAGCLEMLAEIQDQQHPSVVRLKAAIKRWESTLSFWQKLNWRFGRIEPLNRPVTLDFSPGELEHELPPVEGPSPQNTAPSSTSTPMTAA